MNPLPPDDDVPAVLMTMDQVNARRKQSEEQELLPRVTVVGNIHYHVNGEQPETVKFAFDEVSKGGGDSYSRRLVIQGPTEFNFGWVEYPGWFAITNLDTVKPVYFGDYEIPPKGSFFAKRREGAETPLVLDGDDVRVQIFACER